MKWVLIVMLHGWGSGLGSNGNAIAMTEFTSKEKCEAAARQMFVAGAEVEQERGSMQAICVEK